MALGGSTNAVLHLLAIAREAEVDLTIDDFNRIGDTGAAPRRPQAVRPLRDERRRQDRRHPGRDEGAARRRPDARRRASPSPAGRWPRTSSALAPPSVDGDVIRKLSHPIHSTGGLTDPQGLARPGGRGGQVRRLRRVGLHRHRPGLRRRAGRDGRPRPPGAIVAGDVVVIRYEGPKGGPGHARDARDHRRDQGRRARQGRPADHRRPVLRRHDRPVRRATSRPRRSTAARSRSSATATRSPSTSRTGPSTSTVDPDELAARREGWAPNPPKYTRGVLGKYAKVVQSAAHGAVCG